MVDCFWPRFERLVLLMMAERRLAALGCVDVESCHSMPNLQRSKNWKVGAEQQSDG
jgi:hypothetical protein